MTMRAEPSPPGRNGADDSRPVRVSADRWRPTRVGLLNVWQFGNEVLELERGRAVFFGPNGSGKTMALELLLPYLLDARGQLGRLSTSGATERGGFWTRVTGYDESQPRTGYLWVEFVRPSGAVFTCGVRLRANASGSGERHWFTTRLRIGPELRLLDRGSRPLGPQQLREALGDAGTVWGSDTAGYRSAVRRALFVGRSEDQIEALIRTLLVVRKQNVSDGLSPDKLSTLLSQALPPLDDHELGKIAGGFADLDRRRDHIAGLGEDLRVVERLVRENRTYARQVTSGVVQRVITATTELDNVTRGLRHAKEQLNELEGQLQDAHTALKRLDDEAQRLEGEREGIERSEDFREGRALVDFRHSVAEREKELARARRRCEEATQVERSRVKDLEAAQSRATAMNRLLQQARRDLQATVERAGGPTVSDVPDDSLPGILSAWSRGREEAIRILRRVLAIHAKAVARRQHAHAARDAVREKLDEAESELHQARRDEAHEEELWHRAVDEWRGSLRELASNVQVGEMLGSPASARSHVDGARARAREPLIAARAECANEASEIDAELSVLNRELAEWRAGREPEPAAPEGRRSRDGVAGAPLYRLLEFAGSLEPSERDGVESALLAAGFLDAWVNPDGTIAFPTGVSDVAAFAHESVAHDRGGAGSAPVLPDPKTPASDQALAARVLSGVSWVDMDAHLAASPPSGLLVGKDGTWRTPELGGRAPSRPARFIGASSREAARHAKIESLEEQREVLLGRWAACDARRVAVEARLVACDEEASRLPNGTAFDAAKAAVFRRDTRVAERRSVLHELQVAYQRAEEDARERQRELKAAASKHRLPTEQDQLDRAEATVRKVERDSESFSGAQERTQLATQDRDRATRYRNEAAQAVEGAEAEQLTAEREYSRADARFAALEAAVGASFRELASRLETIASRRRTIRDERQSHRRAQLRFTDARGHAHRDVESAESAREAALNQRRVAHGELLDLVADGLLNDAGLGSAPAAEALQTITGQLELARRLRADAALGSPPDEVTITRTSGNVQRRLHDATQRLAGRVSLVFDPRARSWSVLRARQDGDTVAGAELRTRLHDERERARAELDQKQQALFEEVLTGSLREHLRARLWSARDLVDRINRLLGGVRSAAGGVGVSLKWEIDPNQPEAQELRESKRHLLTDCPVGDGRLELDAFLRNRIEQIRADEGDTGEWRDRLERMLDYRDWHRFDVHVHHKRFGERPRSLRSRKVSLSAGEKTIVMVLPLIVAVVAHYEPASEEPPAESPRLLLMDELFPKLDFKNKAQLMGLLPTLELDAVFTSDKDRCEYASLDGIAIHVFQKLDDEQTTTTRMVWNGRSLRVTGEGEDTG